MKVLVFLFFVLAIAEAGVVEFLKKGTFGERWFTDKGLHVKTKLPVWACRVIAIAIACVMSIFMCLADTFTGLRWGLYPIWILIMYIAQYIIDMAFIKKLAYAIIERIEDGNRI